MVNQKKYININKIYFAHFLIKTLYIIFFSNIYLYINSLSTALSTHLNKFNFLVSNPDAAIKTPLFPGFPFCVKDLNF